MEESPCSEARRMLLARGQALPGQAEVVLLGARAPPALGVADAEPGKPGLDAGEAEGLSGDSLKIQLEGVRQRHDAGKRWRIRQRPKGSELAEEDIARHGT